MKDSERDAVAVLIHTSTNAWYEDKLGRKVFSGPWQDCRVFPDVYEELDPGCCLVALAGGGEIAGSCFFHPRETHVSLGIMNASPEFTGQGVARQLLEAVICQAGSLPVRLVSSAMNLDSYSLYTRAGFAPCEVFQDMWFPMGPPDASADGLPAVRDAVPEDVEAMQALEEELAGLRREKDFAMFTENRLGIWAVSVCEAPGGGLGGFLASIDHPGCRMLGPGVARDEETALALILAELRRARGGSPVMLVPSRCPDLVRRLYQMGARNCELHLAQVRGTLTRSQGVVMPTFLPESG